MLRDAGLQASELTEESRTPNGEHSGGGTARGPRGSPQGELEGSGRTEIPAHDLGWPSLSSEMAPLCPGDPEVFRFQLWFRGSNRPVLRVCARERRGAPEAWGGPAPL